MTIKDMNSQDEFELLDTLTAFPHFFKNKHKGTIKKNFYFDVDD